MQLQLQLHCIIQHYATLITLQLQLQLQPQLQLQLQLRYTNYTTLELQLQLHYSALHPEVVGEETTATIATTPKTQLQPPFGPSVDTLCHPCITTTHLSYRVLSLKLPPPPCAVLLVFIRVQRETKILSGVVKHSERSDIFAREALQLFIFYARKLNATFVPCVTRATTEQSTGRVLSYFFMGSFSRSSAEISWNG